MIECYISASFQAIFSKDNTITSHSVTVFIIIILPVVKSVEILDNVCTLLVDDILLMIVVACENILLIEVLKLESSWAGDELSNASELGGEVAIL